jgi:hypothetical protein
MNFQQITIEDLKTANKPYVVYFKFCSPKAIEFISKTVAGSLFNSYFSKTPPTPEAWSYFCLVANITSIRTYWSIEPVSTMYSTYKDSSNAIIPCYINENTVNFSLLRKEISNIRWSEVPEWELFNIHTQLSKVINVNYSSSNSKE